MRVVVQLRCRLFNAPSDLVVPYEANNRAAPLCARAMRVSTTATTTTLPINIGKEGTPREITRDRFGSGAEPTQVTITYFHSKTRNINGIGHVVCIRVFKHILANKTTHKSIDRSCDLCAQSSQSMCAGCDPFSHPRRSMRACALGAARRRGIGIERMH